MQQKNMYDVLIIGSGIAGTALACILAKNGYKVLIVEKGEHPRFAIGESMLPQTAMWMWIVGEHYDIPEIKTLAKHQDICESIGHSCGVKRVIGFSYHKEGQKQAADEGHKLIQPENPIVSESHLFREDIDFFMLKAAIGYGADYVDRTEITDLDFTETHVEARLLQDQKHQARFVVDGSGRNSLISKKFALQENPTRLKTNSRSIFCHVSGLQPYDHFTQSGSNAQRRQWHEGTLQHIFDGGWVWVIPFGNHPMSENTLASIGLQLDANRYPKQQVDPGQEFMDIVSKFPSIADQMNGIEPIRGWISTDRLQYSCKQAIGHRYALMSSAYGFVDPLYSMGMLSSFETVHALARRLLSALSEDDLSISKFSYIDRLQRAQLDKTDKLIHCSYRSMSSFHTWNAMIQLWLANVVFGDTYVFNRCMKYLETGDGSLFDGLEEDPCPGASAPFAKDMSIVFDRFDSTLDKLHANKLSEKEVGDEMLSILRNSDWMPKNIYNWGSSTARHLDFNLVMEEWFEWGRTKAPKSFREKVFDFSPPFQMTA
jgi:FADH2 O2-dependent halogenase